MNVGQRIRDLRKSKKMTISDLANHCSFSQPFLSQIERNKRQVTLKNLITICDVLQISLAEFFCEGNQIVVENGDFLIVMQPFINSIKSLPAEQLRLLASLTPQQLNQITLLLDVIKPPENI